jgi:predicted RNase H-like nuclease (RuvC/YqgF family)
MKYKPQENMPEFSLVVIPLLCCLVAVGIFLYTGNRLLAFQQKKKEDYQSQIRKATSIAKNAKELLASYEDKLRNLRQAKKFYKKCIKKAQRIVEEEKTTHQLRREIAELNRRRMELENQVIQMNLLRRDVSELRRSRKEIEFDIVSVKKKIERLQYQLSSAQQKRQQMAKVFNVGTIKGGKTKSASNVLYVECINNGVILQPKGIYLTHNLSSEEQSKFLSVAIQTGHVVFLIRPDGFKSFKQYRSIITSHNRASTQQIDLGYEPVNADWILNYPSAKEVAYAQDK